MGALVDPPRKAAGIARDAADAYFGEGPDEPFEITSLAVPVYRFNASDSAFDNLEAADRLGWMFFVYQGERVVGIVEVAQDAVGQPRFAGIDLEDERGGLQQVVALVDDYLDNHGFSEVRMLEEPSLNSFFFWLRGPEDLFVDRFRMAVFTPSQLQEVMVRRREKIRGGDDQPTPRDPFGRPI